MHNASMMEETAFVYIIYAHGHIALHFPDHIRPATLTRMTEVLESRSGLSAAAAVDVTSALLLQAAAFETGSA